jgi:hypothetical protein
LASPYEEHKLKATHNEKFVAFLIPEKTQFPDWIATGSFYFALHCVNANAAKLGIDWRTFPPELTLNQRRKISKHTKRVIYVRRYFRNLFTDYNRLLTESMNARYDPIYQVQVQPTTPDTLFQIAQQFKTLM